MKRWHGIAGIGVIVGVAMVLWGLGVFSSKKQHDQTHEPGASPAPSDAAPPDAAPAPEAPTFEAVRVACTDAASPACAEKVGALRRACGDDGRACSNLAIALASGWAGPADMTAAQAASAKACGLDDGQGCAQVARLAFKAKDLPAAYTAAARSCKRTDPDGCALLYALADSGELLSPNQIYDGFETACYKGSDPRACGRAADIQLARTTPRSDHDEAALNDLLAFGCRLMHYGACAAFADRVGADTELGTLAKRRACRLGKKDACGKGEKPDTGPWVETRRIHDYSTTFYEQLPYIDALERALQPCAAMPGAAGAEVAFLLTVSKSGVVDGDVNGPDELLPCIRERLPKQAPPAPEPDLPLEYLIVLRQT
jgi:hypothetical protein